MYTWRVQNHLLEGILKSYDPQASISAASVDLIEIEVATLKLATILPCMWIPEIPQQRL
jgi:hypothetical protein